MHEEYENEYGGEGFDENESRYMNDEQVEELRQLHSAGLDDDKLMDFYSTPNAPKRAELGEMASELSDLDMFMYVSENGHGQCGFQSRPTEDSMEVEFFGGFLDGAKGHIPRLRTVAINGDQSCHHYRIMYGNMNNETMKMNIRAELTAITDNVEENPY